MWLARQYDGDMVCLNTLGQMTTLAMCDAKFHPTRYYSKWGGAGSHLRFENKKISNYTNWNDAKPTKEYTVEEGAIYDPNTRPDSYAMANFILRRFALKPGESREFVMCDYGRNGDKQDDLPSYRVRVEHRGKEKIAVPAGTFDANHVVQTQLTPSYTWFKKGPGHVTEFWYLDDFTIVRILRHREPYEFLLQEYTKAGDAKTTGSLNEDKFAELVGNISLEKTAQTSESK
ncbi:DUF3108 domain-containing protein [bacterium]|nr:DUF3108 domain-containing protein [bacterium]